MKDNAISITVKRPESVSDLISLASCGAKIKVVARPVISTKGVARMGAQEGAELGASFLVEVGEESARFHKTYSKGHSLASAKKAALAFTIANIRLRRDVDSMTEMGVKVDRVPFVMTDLLLGADLSSLAPRAPYDLKQFEILAGVGEPLSITMERGFLESESGRVFTARYVIGCHGVEYEIERTHGFVSSDAETGTIDRALSIVQDRVRMDNRRFLRLGVKLETRGTWADNGIEAGEEPGARVPASSEKSYFFPAPGNDANSSGCGCPSCGGGSCGNESLELRVVDGWSSDSEPRGSARPSLRVVND